MSVGLVQYIHDTDFRGRKGYVKGGGKQSAMLR